MKRINVGVIGLGEVAQVIHLPILDALGHRFRLAAVCDASPAFIETGVDGQSRFDAHI